MRLYPCASAAVGKRVTCDGQKKRQASRAFCHPLEARFRNLNRDVRHRAQKHNLVHLRVAGAIVKNVETAAASPGRTATLQAGRLLSRGGCGVGGCRAKRSARLGSASPASGS